MSGTYGNEKLRYVDGEQRFQFKDVFLQSYI
jgi:hypothetical protein